MTAPLDKTLKRALTIKGRDYVISLSPDTLKATLKGRRRGVELADLLNESQRHLVKLLEQEVLPRDETGNHQQLRFKDLSYFKGERERASEIEI